MKKTLLMAAAALAAGVISTQAQVYSQNVVGYVNTALPAGLSQICAPVGGTNTIESLMPAVQTGDNVFIWTGAGYNIVTYVGPDFDGNGHAWADGNFNGVASPVIKSGQAVFYENTQGTAKTNTFVGNVYTTNTVTLAAGLNMIASTAPIGAGLSSTNLSLPFQTGDNVFIWTGGGYNIVTYVGPDFDGNGHTFADGNFNGVPDPVINVGQGFFYENTQGAPETWIQNFKLQ